MNGRIKIALEFFFEKKTEVTPIPQNCLSILAPGLSLWVSVYERL